MVLLFQVSNESKKCEEIIVRFKVVNGQSVEQSSPGVDVEEWASRSPSPPVCIKTLEECGPQSNYSSDCATGSSSDNRASKIHETGGIAPVTSMSPKLDVTAVAATAPAGTISRVGSSDNDKEQEDTWREDSETETSGTFTVPSISSSEGISSSNSSSDSDSGNENMPPTTTQDSEDGGDSADIGNETVILQAVSTTGVPKVPVPNLLPKNPNVMDLNLYLNRVQNYINHLGYHRVGEPKIRVLTNLSIKHQIETAKALVKAGEPIKCLHALILGIYLTNCSQHIERFPINFKSDFNGKEYKHVVLGLYLYGMFGAIGISRDPGLQDKPAAYPRLFDLILDFQRSYSESGHVLREVKIGGVITHDLHSIEPIAWKIGTVNMELSPSDTEAALERISRQLRSKMGSACLRNVRPTQMVYPTLSSTNNTSSSPQSAPTPPAKLPQAKKSKTSSALLTTSKSKKSLKKQ